ncbi:DUF6126 family protein [Streptomyces gamaensis]|uniref:DUF6126 family protein n=1 Tax=Streptomyces gamaensis TaxID=1763542 RepID=A0ABW0YVG9_9ACTN
MSDTAHTTDDVTGTDPEPTAQTAPAAPAVRTVREEDRAPMGMTMRVFIYLVAVHIFAAFLFLIFYLGGAG